PPPRCDAHQVDPREQRDQPHADRRDERGRPAGEPHQELPRRHADRGDRHTVGAQSLDPTHHEAGARAERLAHEDVLAGGARLARGELGEAQRAQERQRGAQHPGHEGEPRATEPRGDESGRAEDSGADGHPHDHGQAVGQPQRALEVRHTAGECARKNVGAQHAAPPHHPIRILGCYGLRRDPPPLLPWPPPPPPPPPPRFAGAARPPRSPPLGARGALHPPPPPPPPPPRRSGAARGLSLSPPPRRSGARAAGAERSGRSPRSRTSPRSRAGNAIRSPPRRCIASRSRTGVASGRRRVTSAPSGTRNLGPTPPTDGFVPSRSLKVTWTPVPVRTRLMNRLRGRLANPWRPP